MNSLLGMTPHAIFIALNVTKSNFCRSVDNIKEKARGTNFLSMK